MKQMSLSTTVFELALKRTRKREFLNEVSPAGLSAELVALMASHTSSGEKGYRHSRWPAFAQRSNTRSQSSSASLATPMCATEVLQKHQRNSSPCLRYPICGWLAVRCCKEQTVSALARRVKAHKQSQKAAILSKIVLKFEERAFALSLRKPFAFDSRHGGGFADLPRVRVLL
jgi:hypothetical protein